MLSVAQVVILNKDLKSKLVQKKRFNNKIEYWVYRIKKEEGKLYLPDGTKSLIQDKEKSFLFCIVVCEPTNHIKKRTKEGILVEGLKLSGDSVNKYLKKTNRHLD